MSWSFEQLLRPTETVKEVMGADKDGLSLQEMLEQTELGTMMKPPVERDLRIAVLSHPSVQTIPAKVLGQFAEKIGDILDGCTRHNSLSVRDAVNRVAEINGSLAEIVSQILAGEVE